MSSELTLGIRLQKCMLLMAMTCIDATEIDQYSASASLHACCWNTCKVITIIMLAADWDLALGVNVKGYAFGIKHASLQMIKQRESSCSNLTPEEAAVLDMGHAIVNVSSISAFMAQPGFVPYSSTKAAINEMTRCCALDLGKHCIR